MTKPYVLTKEDLNRIKAGLRSAFARSEIHHAVLKKAIRQHSDPSRPRVKTWAECYICKKLEAKSYMQVDHVQDMYVPLDKSFADLTPYEMIYRLWCSTDNLAAVCIPCHKAKSSLERKARAALKRGKGTKKKSTR